MVRMTLGLVLTLLLAGCCATAPEGKLMHALYDKFDNHCRGYARQMSGEADENSRYLECMNYFIENDIDCPYCVIDPHKKSE